MIHAHLPEKFSLIGFSPLVAEDLRLEAHGCTPWATNLSIVPPYIRYAKRENYLLYIVVLEHVNEPLSVRACSIVGCTAALTKQYAVCVRVSSVFKIYNCLANHADCTL